MSDLFERAAKFFHELQADIDYTRDDGKTWHTANDVANLPSPGAGSNSPFLVDRPWIAAYSPDTNYKHTQVTDLRLKATKADGSPIEIQHQFEQGGLAGAFGGKR